MEKQKLLFGVNGTKFFVIMHRLTIDGNGD